MKITSVDLIALEPTRELDHPVVCRINTDEGIYGLGEAGVAIVCGGKAAYELIRDYTPMILGMDPLHQDVIWEKIYRSAFWTMGNGAIVMAALSAIDTALWDIKGKYYNAPVYELLGGKHHDRLRAYASQLQFGWHVDRFEPMAAPEQYAQAAREAMADGYDAIKVNFIGKLEDGSPTSYKRPRGYLDHKMLHMLEERLAAVREAVGPDVDLLCENNVLTDVTSAVQFAQAAARYDIMYLEEPAVPMNPQVMKQIADKSPIPLASGERIYTRWGYLPFLRDGSLALLQPDIGNCGGITEARKIADLAHIYDVGIQTHTCSSPISVAVALQVEAALPNFVIHEHHVINELERTNRMGLYEYRPRNGYFDVPDLPGIGQDLSEYALRHARIETIR